MSCIRCGCVILGDGTEDADFRSICEDCEVELEMQLDEE